MKKKNIYAIIISLIFLLAAVNIFIWSEGNKNNNAQLSGPYKVVRVVDGDTIVVKIDSENIKVRLIGIDCPESVHPDGSLNTPEGEAASKYTKELLTSRVYLEYDAQLLDEYARTLAYVYLSDGRTMVNRELLKAGQASVMTIQPNSKYADEFYALQKKAQEEGIGIWADR